MTMLLYCCFNGFYSTIKVALYINVVRLTLFQFNCNVNFVCILIPAGIAYVFPLRIGYFYLLVVFASCLFYFDIETKFHIIIFRIISTKRILEVRLFYAFKYNYRC